MFDIGFGEMLVVGIIALLVLGPERLPGAARTAGQFIRKMRDAWNGVRSEVERELEAEELRRNLREAREHARRAEEVMRDTVRRTNEGVRESVDAVRESVREAREQAGARAEAADQARQSADKAGTGAVDEDAHEQASSASAHDAKEPPHGR
ncbi:Sec-independent protein translocase protein TatB [Oleiagrimonas sp. C23AA]|uniref:Sec-independent protein translocase protein TatB n=1 Tax=Oleiagrimonas sp. C23AA TaxID=2719047 RepID=UPI00141E5985|nr:Sec-independent protein translocase protein TatB [Oleiagrimonas sp. C23AA]NII12149.1 twin-arginine translocase subunit TatB [Oleiagrimonas sp. C23AA]